MILRSFASFFHKLIPQFRGYGHGDDEKKGGEEEEEEEPLRRAEQEQLASFQGRGIGICAEHQIGPCGVGTSMALRKPQDFCERHFDFVGRCSGWEIFRESLSGGGADLNMGRTSGKKDLTDNYKRAIVVGRQYGLTMTTLAGMFGVTEACISQFLKRQKAQDGSTNSQRTGRPRVTDRNDDRNILKTSRTNPRLTAPAIRREVFLISPSPPSVSTVKRRLNAAGIMGRRPVKKPLISEKNRASRVKWAKEHLNWTRQGWNKILWSDENKFLLFGSDGIQWDRFVGPQNLVPVLTGPVEMLLRPLHPGGSILFRNQRRRFTVETDGGDREFKKTSCLIAGAVSLGLVLDVFKMFLSPLRSLTRCFPELRNARLCHAEHSCQRHHGQSILTTHNDGSFVVISQILFSRGSSHV
ncbi:unnamed protein product [Caenorhabditis auriculariae]|uniref:Transposase Tc1-like domain-containing protein n=1 Tax=Caenorhabditis auriculariae TaxID=2777116 RepID=A0A8S1HMM9_9PELO|nr:unnamed protein product [Caenorhabditis auriculariae]